MTQSAPPTPVATLPSDPSLYRILSFDGGPSSALQIRLLRYLEERQPGFLARTQAFAGTSDGSFMALYLASHVTEDHHKNLRVIDQAIEFSNAIDAAFAPTVCGLLRGASGLGPLVSGEKLESCLVNAYGDTRLYQLKKNVVVASFDKKIWEPMIVHNFPPADLHGNWTLVETALASSAFPIVLPIFRPRTNGGQYLDGGFSANNPSLAAATRITRFLAPPGHCPSNELRRLRILSLGARQSREQPVLELCEAINRFLGIFQGEFINWGYWQWLLHLPMRELILIMLGSDDETSYQAEGFMGTRYFRYEPKMNELLMGWTIMLRKARVSAAQLDKLAKELSTSPGLALTADWIGTRGWMAPETVGVPTPAS